MYGHSNHISPTNFISRYKLNLSKKDWNQVNNGWLNNTFKKYDTMPPKLCTWENKKNLKLSKFTELSISPILNTIQKEEFSIMSERDLMVEIMDLKLKVITLSIINVGLVILHFVNNFYVHI